VSMTPTINGKNVESRCFFIFFEILLGWCLHSYNYFYLFSLIFTLWCRQADIVATVSLSVSLLPAINIASVVVTGV
jgi:hypothetical protein